MPLPLGFALIADKAGIKYACNLNEKINETYPSDFVLKRKGNLLPHMSLFHGVFPEERWEDVRTIISEIYHKNEHKINVKTSGINLWATRIFFLDIEKRNAYRLHEAFFRAYNLLRIPESTDSQALIGISDAERKSLELYKSPFVLGTYRPHFTLGRAETPKGNEEEFAKQIERDLPPPNYITFEKLVIFDVGRYGRLERVREEFHLK